MDDGQRMMEHGLFTDTRKNVDIWGDYLWRKWVLRVSRFTELLPKSMFAWVLRVNLMTKQIRRNIINGVSSLEPDDEPDQLSLFTEPDDEIDSP